MVLQDVNLMGHGRVRWIERRLIMHLRGGLWLRGRGWEISWLRNPRLMVGG